MQKNVRKDHLREYKDYKGVSNEINQLTTVSLGETFSRHLKNTHTGFMGVSTHQNFEHLNNTYGKTTELDLQQNEENTKQHWNQEEPIETVFQQLEEGITHAQYGNSYFTNTQMLYEEFVIMA